MRLYRTIFIKGDIILLHALFYSLSRILWSSYRLHAEELWSYTDYKYALHNNVYNNLLNLNLLYNWDCVLREYVCLVMHITSAVKLAAY